MAISLTRLQGEVFYTGMDDSIAEYPDPEPLQFFETHPHVLLRGAYMAQLNGDNRQAIQLFEQLIRIDPDLADSHVRMEYALLLLQENRKEEAVEQAQLAYNMDKTDSYYAEQMGAILRGSGKLYESRRFLEEVLTIFPGNAKLEFQLAESCYDLSRENDAIVHYKQTLFSLDTVGYLAAAYRNRALWRLATLYHTRNDEERARIHLIRYIKHNPENLYARYILGYLIYFRQSRYKKAQEQLEIIEDSGSAEMVRFNIDPARIYSALGQIRYLYKSDQTVRTLRSALHFNNKDILAEGLLSESLGRSTLALKYLLPYFKSKHDDLVVRMAFIRILEKSQQKEALFQELLVVAELAHQKNKDRLAIDLLRQAHVMSGDEEMISDGDHQTMSKIRTNMFELMADSYENLHENRRAIFYKRLALDEAKNAGILTEETKEKAYPQKLQIAVMFSREDVTEFDRALDICNRVIQENSDYHYAYFIRGIVHLRMAMANDAQEDFSHAIALGGEDKMYLYYRSVANEILGNYDDVENDLVKVLGMDDEFAEAANSLGYINAKRGKNLQESRKWIQKAVDQSPANGAYQDSLGWIYYKMGDLDRALYHVQLASMLMEEDGDEIPVILDHLGDIYLQKKEDRRALAAYRRALRLIEKKKDETAIQRSPLKQKELRDDLELESKIKVKIDHITIE